MKDDKSKAKRGDDEMTVVVPPSKQQKPAAADAEGDVAMDVDEAPQEEKGDPVAQTVAGEWWGKASSGGRGTRRSWLKPPYFARASVSRHGPVPRQTRATALLSRLRGPSPMAKIPARL
jgi:hypothetical protein